MQWVGALGILVVQVVALVATFFSTRLGTAWWHHLASLGVVILAALALATRMRSRRFLGVGVLVTTVLAAASGFWLLYWKEGIRIGGYQDWGVWWHVTWSWMAAVFFWQHTWVNRVAFAHFFRRSLRTVARASVHLGLYAVAVAGFLVSAGPGRTWFHNENYIELSVWTWLLATSVAYAAWWALRRRGQAFQKRARGGVDLGLVPAAAIAVISGIPILWFDASLKAAGLQYASKFWHVGPSVLFSVLVFAHTVQLWSTVKGHWNRLSEPEPRAIRKDASRPTAALPPRAADPAAPAGHDP